ncbi:unnamed protein product [Clavelina lepadiformis]|uniref:UspA domain-containing protein n=1 Tax=Clavelina lepadiformis TaxID=159417 RepID=A0ABP0FQF7_CLALP
MKVVLCVDGSTSAEEAFSWYFRSFHTQGNEVLAVYVGNQPHLPSFVFYEEAVFPKEEFQRAVQKCKSKMEEMKAKYLSKAKAMQVNCQFRVLVGDGGSPGETLASFLESENADLVIVGSRGMGKIRRTVLGSVSDFLVHHAKVPVLVFREE